eukprot:scaffold565_cov379-Pinguiococcus_pyrenoidosus.AAC.11
MLSAASLDDEVLFCPLQAITRSAPLVRVIHRLYLPRERFNVEAEIQVQRRRRGIAGQAAGRHFHLGNRAEVVEVERQGELLDVKAQVQLDGRRRPVAAEASSRDFNVRERLAALLPAELKVQVVVHLDVAHGALGIGR